MEESTVKEILMGRITSKANGQLNYNTTRQRYRVGVIIVEKIDFKNIFVPQTIKIIQSSKNNSHTQRRYVSSIFVKVFEN